MSAVFESGVPKFIGTDTNSVTLHYSVIELNPDKSIRMFQSPVSESGKRTWKVKGLAANHGRHMTFNVRVELHKFDSTPLTAPYNTSKSVAALLLGYEDDDVTFYPFYNSGNELAVKNNAGTVVKCHFVDIKFGFHVQAGALLDYRDLVFMTNDFMDIRKIVKT